MNHGHRASQHRKPCQLRRTPAREAAVAVVLLRSPSAPQGPLLASPPPRNGGAHPHFPPPRKSDWLEASRQRGPRVASSSLCSGHDLEFLTPPPPPPPSLPPHSWNSRCAPPGLVHAVLGVTTQGFMSARHTLYLLSYTASPELGFLLALLFTSYVELDKP